MGLTKLPETTVVPGDPGQPYRAATTVCVPPPPPDNSGTTPPSGGTPTGTLIHLHVPNNPTNPAAGEVMTDAFAPAPAGYTCGPATVLVPDPTFPNGYIPVGGIHCYWNYPP